MGVSMRAQPARASSTPLRLRHARTCYDHLAGEVAVGVYAFMVEAQWLTTDGDTLTPEGREQLLGLGVKLNPRPRRKACCPCLDWSERRYHLGGDAGAALLALFLEKRWLSQAPGYRELTVTERGRTALQQLFRIDFTCC
ncbi:MAG TPA: transcriptional regulator [Enterobacteriaceae bacterium]|nr:transcriptional regulator [Enterobacteriaceae bacterium]